MIYHRFGNHTIQFIFNMINEYTFKKACLVIIELTF